jgi:CheY-like chemotaxis protein
MKTEPQVADQLIGQGETVLVVEDDTPIRRIVVRYFRELGFNVVEAKNGSEAIAQLESTGIDVLFTDVVMPGSIDGYQLACLAQDRWPGLNVILTSGFPQTKLTNDLAATNFRLLSKPYRKTDLAQIVRDVAEAARADGMSKD